MPTPLPAELIIIANNLYRELIERNTYHSEAEAQATVRYAIKVAKRYHEHMMRWRPVSEKPKNGLILIAHNIEQWIECVEYSDDTEAQNLYLTNATHWMPATMPESAKE